MFFFQAAGGGQLLCNKTMLNLNLSVSTVSYHGSQPEWYPLILNNRRRKIVFQICVFVIVFVIFWIVSGIYKTESE